MFCIRCGAELPADSKFCVKCGAKVAAAPESASMANAMAGPADPASTAPASATAAATDAVSAASASAAAPENAPAAAAPREAAAQAAAPESATGPAAPQEATLTEAVQQTRTRARRRVPLIVLVALAFALTAGVAYAAFYVYTEIIAPAMQSQQEEQAGQTQGDAVEGALSRAEAAYEDVLDEYRTVLASDELMAAGVDEVNQSYPHINPSMLYFFSSKSLNSQYYAERDLNGDGTPELLISYGKPDAKSTPTKGGGIYDIFTYLNGQVVRLSTGSAENGYFICQDNVVMGYSNEGSASIAQTSLYCQLKTKLDRLDIEWSANSPAPDAWTMLDGISVDYHEDSADTDYYLVYNASAGEWQNAGVFTANVDAFNQTNNQLQASYAIDTSIDWKPLSKSQVHTYTTHTLSVSVPLEGDLYPTSRESVTWSYQTIDNPNNDAAIESINQQIASSVESDAKLAESTPVDENGGCMIYTRRNVRISYLDDSIVCIGDYRYVTSWPPTGSNTHSIYSGAIYSLETGEAISPRTVFNLSENALYRSTESAVVGYYTNYAPASGLGGATAPVVNTGYIAASFDIPASDFFEGATRFVVDDRGLVYYPQLCDGNTGNLYSRIPIYIAVWDETDSNYIGQAKS